MGEADKNTTVFGECKWTNEYVDVSVLDTLVYRSKPFPYKNAHLYIFSKMGFTKGCIDKACELKNITLVTYEDILASFRDA